MVTHKLSLKCKHVWHWGYELLNKSENTHVSPLITFHVKMTLYIELINKLVPDTSYHVCWHLFNCFKYFALTGSRRSDQNMDQPKHFRTSILNFESNVELIRLIVSWFNHFNYCSIGQNNYQTFKNNWAVMKINLGSMI
jgi:hypothetical protein